MSEHVIISLGFIVLLGFAAQWISWAIKLPSILFLLLFGLLAGPVLGFINPDKLLGEVLIPFVSISVAVILFEGGLTLKIKEFKEIGKVVILLITAGVLITWIATTAAAYLILNINIEVSVLLGAVLTVTGPTVIIPLLRNIRPTQRIGNILKWEGILIDPIGALLAILVFQAILIGEVQSAMTAILLSLLKTIIFVVAIGGAFAMLLTLIIKKYWVPDYLQQAAALTFVVTAFLVSNYIQEESGLLAATIMGIVFTNQKYVPIKRIKDFKENLTILMIPILFILLSARLSLSDIELISYSGILFLVILLFLIRPISVFVSTINSKLNIKEKLFIGWMAPRGIVAAAVSSVFALKLMEINLPQIEYLVPVTFLVIIGTVIIYSLTSPQLAKLLGLSQSNPQGIVIAGAQDWALQLALVLQEKEYKVVILDTDRYNINKAKMMGLTALNESIISNNVIDKINLEGVGKLFAMTSNDEANSLGVLHFSEIFDQENLFQLHPDTNKDEQDFSPLYLRGRYLFDKVVNYTKLTQRFYKGATIKSTNLTEKFGYDDFKQKYGETVIPLLLIDEDENILPVVDEENNIKQGNTLIALVDDNDQTN